MTDSQNIADLQQRVAQLERTVAYLMDQLHIQYVDQPRIEVSADVFALVKAGNKIGAIKLYREQTGADIKQAKDIIDRLG
jgi:ribosomal protein L7/L12